ncbi:MAG TPA: MoaD/ThiS family protein [Anaerolineales bacterium]|nr:MoaD/ThiS family protein [Anaerolineales bacterium]
MIRVRIPYHLQVLAQVGREVVVNLDEEATVGGVLDALERDHPVLRGTIRNHDDGKRRPFLRFFACGEDVTLEGFEFKLPGAIQSGEEPFRVIGGMAGG